MLLLCGFLFSLSGQNQKVYVHGEIRDTTGEVLPFASVYSSKTDYGTSSNLDGRYAFNIFPGSDRIIFQFIGYQQRTISVDAAVGDSLEINVKLVPTALELDQVLIAGDRNPADEIMRAVMKKRPEYERLSNAYQAQVYIKGLYRLKDAPEKIMGFDIGGLDSIMGDLPTNIIYLSETRSQYARSGRKSKEEVQASKTSGMKNFPSINRASLLDVNFYESTPSILDRPVKSPLADNAFAHYKFSLLGQYTDNNGYVVYKIGVNPRRGGDPLFSGYIEVVDEEWFLHGLELTTDGRRLNIEFIDTLTLRQAFLDRKGASVWPVVQSDFRISGSGFGFVVDGGFTGVKSEFIFDPEAFTLDFDRVLLKYSEDALDKDSTFWRAGRPIQLSSDELLDYQVKDSIAERVSDPAFQDSVDRERSKFGLMNLLSSYSYVRRSKGISWSVNSPLINIEFNPTQGWKGEIDGNFRKDWKEGRRNKTSFEIYGNLGYGTADERWRSWGQLAFQHGLDRPLLLKLTGGYRLNQISRERPISLNANQFSNLFFKNHFIRFYDQTQLQLELNKNLGGGWEWSQSFNYENRSLVQNNSNYSFFLEERDYPVNIPDHQDVENNPEIWQENEILLLKGRLQYRPGLSYVDLPQQRIEVPGQWPTLGLSYAWGVSEFSSHSDFFRLESDVKYNLKMGILGYSNWVAKAGTFVRNEQLTFFDYKHFSGNQFYISKGDYRETFLNLPYYQFSTSTEYFEFHWLHNFQGYLLNKIPGVRRLGFALEAKGSYLFHDDIGHYNELSLGLDRLGWGLFRLFRLDLGLSFVDGQYQDWRIIFGSQFSFDDFTQKGTRL